METYYVHLTEHDMQVLMRALISACIFETEYLNYFDYCEDTRKEPGICGLRNNVIEYCMRHTLLEKMAIVNGQEPPCVDDPVDTDFWMVVDGWNKEIKRIRGEPHEG